MSHSICLSSIDFIVAKSSRKKSLFGIFNSKENNGTGKLPTTAHEGHSLEKPQNKSQEGTTLKNSQNEVQGGLNLSEGKDDKLVDSGAAKFEAETKRKKSIGLVLFENFGKKKKLNEQNDEDNRNRHLDNSDNNEKERQENEIQKESIHTNDLAHKFVESYKELMEIKERFEFERLAVQRAQVKRFLCGVFHDIEAIVQERKYEKTLFDHVGDFFYNSIPTFSPSVPEKVQENESELDIQSDDSSNGMSDHDNSVKKVNQKNSENEGSQCILA